MNARKWEWIINKDIRQNSKTTTKAMKTPILTGLTSFPKLSFILSL